MKLLRMMLLRILAPLLMLTISQSFAELPQAKVLHAQDLFVSPMMAKGGSALAKHEVSKGKKLPVAKDKFGVAQYRIPQIIQTSHGYLVVAVSARLSLPSDHGWSSTFFAISQDRGKTWKYIRRNTNYGDRSTPQGNKAGPFPLTDGTQDTVVMQHPQTKKFTAVYIDKSSGKAYSSQSKNLQQWSRPTPLPQNKDFSYLCPGPASPQVDPEDNSIVMMMHGAGQGNTKSGAYLVKSRDGLHFNFSQQPMPGSEAAVIPLGKNTYLAQSRGSKRRMAIFEKDSLVKTFDFPGQSYPGCAASLARHGNTCYFLSPTGPKRQHGVLYRSLDRGKTWEALCSVHTKYFSYSSMTVLDDRHITIVSERHFDPSQRKLMNIHYCVVELPEQ